MSSSSYKKYQTLYNKYSEQYTEGYNDAVRIYKILTKQQSVPDTIATDYAEAYYNYCLDSTTTTEKATAQVTITDYLASYSSLKKLNSAIESTAEATNKMEYYSAKMREANTSNVESVTETKIQTDTSNQSGHIYPVTLVSNATNKLKSYNAQLSNFIKKIEAMESKKVDITWLCKMAEAFCRRINYALALLRYMIIKSLHGMYNQANTVIGWFEPITNASVSDLGSCVSWITSCISFFLKPYELIVQFISDFATYTPPLITEAATLVKNVATIPVKLVSKIDLVAESKDGELQQLAEIYKDSISIKMESIKLSDITGGVSKDDKPKYSSYVNSSNEKEILETKEQTYSTQLDTYWSQMLKQMQKAKRDSNTRAVYPEKVKQLSKVLTYYSKNLTGTSLLTPEEAAIWIFGETSVKSSNECWTKTFFTTQYELYRTFSASELLTYITSDTLGDTLKTYVLGYYLDTSITEYRPYVDFLLKYDGAYNGVITTYIAKIQETSTYLGSVYASLETIDNVTVFQ